MERTPRAITALLQLANEGSDAARDELIRVTYDELRRMARRHLASERPGHTLQPTALVNEVQLRLLGSTRLPVGDRGRFLGFVAKAMRNVLVDHARARKSRKRLGDCQRVALTDDLAVAGGTSYDLVALDEALERLHALDERKARVVELKHFAGLTGDEIAGVLAVSPATVDRDWETARTWLYGELSRDAG